MHLRVSKRKGDHAELTVQLTSSYAATTLQMNMLHSLAIPTAQQCQSLRKQTMLSQAEYCHSQTDQVLRIPLVLEKAN